jgi:hypothetical protein
MRLSSCQALGNVEATYSLDHSVGSEVSPKRRYEKLARAGGAALEAPAKRLAVASAFLARKERTDRNVISIGVSEGELHGLSVRIHVRLLFETSDECTCPLQR